MRKLYLLTLTLLASASAFAQCTDLFFSEYIEGSSNNKAFEIYNPTSSAVDLSDYLIVMNYNPTDVNDTTYNVMLAPGEVFVVAADAADAAILAEADEQLDFPSVVHFNGDDMLALVKISTGDTIDKIGLFGQDPGDGWTVNGVANGTKDHTLVRMSSVQAGTNDWSVAANTWNVEANNDFSFLGSHTMTPCGTAIDTMARFSPNFSFANEGDGTFDLEMLLNVTTNGGSHTVDVVLKSGDPADLDGYTTQTVTFNTTTAESLTLTLTDDAMMEGTETFEFALRNPSMPLMVGADSIFTLELNDNDFPLYAIGDINNVDANGEADSAGVGVRVIGTVNSMDRGFNSTEFSIQDNGTGEGISVFMPSSSTVSYTPTIGDEIEVVATVGQNAGVIQLEFVTEINVLTSGNSLDIVVKSTVEELNESHLIRINDLTLVDPSQWAAAGGAGFDVFALNPMGDTVLIRIDRDYDEMYNSNPPCDTFDIVGVSSQFDTDAPFTSGYQILPRMLSDVIGEFNCVTDIADITGVDGNGEAESEGQNVTVTGQVISVNYSAGGLQFFIHDNTDGIGVFAPSSANDFGYTVTEGDIVTLRGEVDQFNGLTQIGFLDTLIVESTGNPLIAPTAVTALDESTESELILIKGLTLDNPGDWGQPGSFFEVEASDDAGRTFTIQVDAETALFNEPAPSGCFDVIGVGTQFDNTAPFLDNYKILPRYVTDISVCNSVQRLEDVGVSMYPVPAENQLILEGVESFTTIEIVDANGRVVSSLDATRQISVAHLPSGVYSLHLIGAKEQAASLFIKK